jgi:hypothetical protein
MGYTRWFCSAMTGYAATLILTPIDDAHSQFGRYQVPMPQRPMFVPRYTPPVMRAPVFRMHPRSMPSYRPPAVAAPRPFSAPTPHVRVPHSSGALGGNNKTQRSFDGRPSIPSATAGRSQASGAPKEMHVPRRPEPGRANETKQSDWGSTPIERKRSPTTAAAPKATPGQWGSTAATGNSAPRIPAGMTKAAAPIAPLAGNPGPGKGIQSSGQWSSMRSSTAGNPAVGNASSAASKTAAAATATSPAAAHGIVLAKPSAGQWGSTSATTSKASVAPAQAAASGTGTAAASATKGNDPTWSSSAGSGAPPSKQQAPVTFYAPTYRPSEPAGTAKGAAPPTTAVVPCSTTVSGNNWSQTCGNTMTAGFGPMPSDVAARAAATSPSASNTQVAATLQTPATNNASSPPTNSPSPAIDTTYELRSGETIAAYNARIAAYNASQNAPAPSSTGAPVPTSIPAQKSPPTTVDTTYQVRSGETIDAYNARIAAYNASKNAPPSVSPSASGSTATPAPTSPTALASGTSKQTSRNPLTTLPPSGNATIDTRVAVTTPAVVPSGLNSKEPTPITLFAHYYDRSGTPLSVNFKDVSVAPRATDFPDIKALVSQGKPGTYSVRSQKSVSASGFDHIRYGNIDVETVGKLTINKDGTWKYTGKLASARNDTFNCDASTHRSPAEEFATTACRKLGEKIGSKSFKLQFSGEQDYSDSGR